MNGSRKSGLIEIDLGRHTVHVNGVEAGLTLTEFELLLVLTEYAPSVATPQELLRRAGCYVGSLNEARETVRWFMHHLRRKLGDDLRRPWMIVNVRRKGYRLDAGVLVVREARSWTAIRNFNRALLSVGPLLRPLAEQDQAGPAEE